MPRDDARSGAAAPGADRPGLGSEPTRRARRVDRDFVLLLALLALVNAKYFAGRFLPAHDSLGNLEYYYAFFRSYVFDGEIPRWIPVGFDGVQSDYFQLLFLSPSQYLVAFVAAPLGARDVLTLYAASQLIDQVFLLLGTYLLAGRLLRTRAARLYVCIGVIATAFYWTQVVWELRLWYLQPLGIYLLLRFFEEGRLALLLAAAACPMLMMFGVPTYVIPIHALFYAVLAGSLLLFRAVRLPVPLPRPWAATAASLALLLLLTATMGAMAMHGIGHLAHYAPDRDPTRLGVDVDSFLHYAHPSPARFLELVFAAPQDPDLNTTVYVGLITLVLALYGAFASRSPWLKPLWATVLLFAAFSVSSLTFVAPALYHVPLLSLFRHVGQVMPFIKLGLLLLAGLGLDAFLAEPAEPGRLARFRRIVPSLARLAAAVAFLILVVDLGLDRVPPYRSVATPGDTGVRWFHWIALAVLALFALQTHVFRRRPRAARGALVVAWFGFEILSYDTALYYGLPVRRPRDALADLFELRPALYQETRVLEREQHPRGAEAKALLGRWGARDAVLDLHLDIDGCERDLRRNFINEAVDRLLRARVGLAFDDRRTRFPERALSATLPTGNEAPIAPLDDLPLRRAFGCGAPKLLIAQDVTLAANREAAAAIIKSTADVDRIFVLTRGDGGRVDAVAGTDATGGLGGAGHPPAPGAVGGQVAARGAPGADAGTSGGADPPAPGVARMIEYRANALRIEADVPGRQGAWLVYRDAFHPAWRARVDGAPADIVEANLAFRAVHVPPGHSIVEMRYEDRTATLLSDAAAGLSSLSVAALLLWAAAVAFPRSKGPSPAGVRGSVGLPPDGVSS